MDKIKCIIVEDEIPSAEELRYVLSCITLLKLKVLPMTMLRLLT